MKKSDVYKLAQCAVLEYRCLSTEEKLEILRELMSDFSLALFSEEQEAKKQEEEF